MRILIYSGNFFPEKTGIGKYTGEMAAWFADRGHAVDVITGFPYYPEWKLGSQYARTGYRSESWQNVNVYRVPHYIPGDGRVTSVRRILVDLTIFMSSTWNWLGILLKKKRRPDVVIAVCPPLFSGIWPSIAKTLCGIPWVYHVQDFQLDAAMGLKMIRSNLLISILARIESRLIASGNRASSITPSMCRHLVKKGALESNVLELPNWTDLTKVHPIDRDTDFRADNGIDKSKVLVMYAGAMGQKQGLSLVLDAAEQLLEDDRVQFLMVGAGPYAEQLQQEAADRKLTNIRFLPLQPLEKLNELLGSADVHLIIQKSSAADLVMPSKLVNVLAAGRASIVTADKDTELWDVVNGAEAGLVIPSESLPHFVGALKSLINQPELRTRLGANARRYAENHLGQDKILKRFEHELYLVSGLEAQRLRVQLAEEKTAHDIETM